MHHERHDYDGNSSDDPDDILNTEPFRGPVSLHLIQPSLTRLFECHPKTRRMVERTNRRSVSAGCTPELPPNLEEGSDARAIVTSISNSITSLVSTSHNGRMIGVAPSAYVNGPASIRLIIEKDMEHSYWRLGWMMNHTDTISTDDPDAEMTSTGFFLTKEVSEFYKSTIIRMMRLAGLIAAISIMARTAYLVPGRFRKQGKHEDGIGNRMPGIHRRLAAGIAERIRRWSKAIFRKLPRGPMTWLQGLSACIAILMIIAAHDLLTRTSAYASDGITGLPERAFAAAGLIIGTCFTLAVTGFFLPFLLRQRNALSWMQRRWKQASGHGWNPSIRHFWHRYRLNRRLERMISAGEDILIDGLVTYLRQRRMPTADLSGEYGRISVDQEGYVLIDGRAIHHLRHLD